MSSLLVVSCRKDFWSAVDFSPANDSRRIDLNTGAGTQIARSRLLQELSAKRLMVLVHGYNNQELDVVDSYRTIDRQMRLLGFMGHARAPYDALVGFVWPGGATGVSFPFARQRAEESAARFSRLLTDLRSVGATIDLNTNSLGAHVALEALRETPSQGVRNAWNFASAVDNESIEVKERYFEASRKSERFYVFHSRNDPVLRVWYRIGDLFDFDTALGYSGPEDAGAIITHSPHVRVVNCKDVVASHGGYRSTGQVWAYMSQELTSRSSPQFVTLQKTAEAFTAVFAASAGAALGAPTAPPTRTRAGRRRRNG